MPFMQKNEKKVKVFENLPNDHFSDKKMGRIIAPKDQKKTGRYVLKICQVGGYPAPTVDTKLKVKTATYGLKRPVFMQPLRHRTWFCHVASDTCIFVDQTYVCHFG